MTVQDLLERTLTRLPGPALCSIFDAVGGVQDIIVNRMLLRRSDMLSKDPPAEITYAVGDDKSVLPADYVLLSGRPYLPGQTPLSPLAGRDTAGLQIAGDPRFFSVTGHNLCIYPPTDKAIVLMVPYFFKPPAPSSLADALPFNGEFDSVIIDGCVAVMSHGMAALSERGFVSIIQAQVDGRLDAREMLAEQLIADSINGI